MNSPTIIFLLGFGLFLWFMINRAMKTWYSRKDGTGEEVELSELGRRGWKGSGNVQPDTITKLEEKLKDPENVEYKR